MSNQGVVTTNRIEKNKKKKNIINQNKKADELFDKFWVKYPRKVGRQVAIRAFNKLTIKNKKLAIDKIDAHIEHWVKNDTLMEHIPHASSWLNQERFNDELESVNLKEQTRLNRIAKQDKIDREERERLSVEANTPEAKEERRKAIEAAKRAVRGF